MNEARLIEKLKLIEALFAGATTDGERVAAECARTRIQERLKLSEKEDPPTEYRFTMSDMWSRKVFVALLRRYGIRPYRYRRQRYTTVMAKVSSRFVDETLWPEFKEISEGLRAYLAEVTDRVVEQVIHQDSSEAEVVDDPAQLTGVVASDVVKEPEHRGSGNYAGAGGSADSSPAMGGGTESSVGGGAAAPGGGAKADGGAKAGAKGKNKNKKKKDKKKGKRRRK